MRMPRIDVFAPLLLTACWLASGCNARMWASATTGVFENHTDVGIVLHPGALDYDSALGTYTVSGSGVNMWSTADAFHFVWKQVSGDVALAADISFVGSGGNEHRKAVLMVRQNLEADSVYADVALHGNGLTALQYRDEKGVATHEVRANILRPRRLRIEKRGDFIYLFLADGEQAMRYSGASMRVPLQGTFYVGIGICSIKTWWGRLCLRTFNWWRIWRRRRKLRSTARWNESRSIPLREVSYMSRRNGSKPRTGCVTERHFSSTEVGVFIGCPLPEVSR
ncbi:MAG: hypothetical protein WCB11_01590, partial [Terriglobales bacterium]